MEKASLTLRNWVIFSKKWYDFSSKNPQKVQKYWKSKNGIKTALRPLFKELWAILENIGFQAHFCFFVRFLFSCHILSCSLRGPTTQPLHTEGRRPVYLSWKSIYLPLDFFFCGKGYRKGPGWGPWGPDPMEWGPNSKKVYLFFPTGEGPSWGPESLSWKSMRF